MAYDVVIIHKLSSKTDLSNPSRINKAVPTSPVHIVAEVGQPFQI